MKKYRNPHRIKKKKSIIRSRFFWLPILILIILGGISYSICFSSIFQIKEIEIFGNQKISYENVKSLIEEKINKKILIFPSKSIFLVNLGEINKAVLEKFPQISQFYLKRKFPDKISVEIEERKPVAIFCQNDKCFLFDIEGIIFEEMNRIENVVDIGYRPVEIRNLMNQKELKLGEKMIEKEQLSRILEIESKLRDYNPPSTRGARDEREGGWGVGVPQERAPNLKIAEVSIISEEKLNAKTLEGWEIYFNTSRDIDWQLTKLKAVLEKEIPPEKRGNLEYIDLRFEKVYFKYR